MGGITVRRCRHKFCNFGDHLLFGWNTEAQYDEIELCHRIGSCSMKVFGGLPKSSCQRRSTSNRCGERKGSPFQGDPATRTDRSHNFCWGLSTLFKSKEPGNDSVWGCCRSGKDNGIWLFPIFSFSTDEVAKCFRRQHRYHEASILIGQITWDSNQSWRVPSTIGWQSCSAPFHGIRLPHRNQSCWRTSHITLGYIHTRTCLQSRREFSIWERQHSCLLIPNQTIIGLIGSLRART